MIINKLMVGGIVFSVAMLAGCSGVENHAADLDRVLDVAAETMDKFEGNTSGVTKENAMEIFSKDYAQNLNHSRPMAYPDGVVGVSSEADGSFVGYADANNNQVKDAGESDLFKLEVDAENKRLIASDENAVRDSPFSGMMTGLLAGMLISNMLNRQRATGANPASKKATPRSAYRSARSRAGSGSHTSGK
jgi:hypothetical protein